MLWKTTLVMVEATQLTAKVLRLRDIEMTMQLCRIHLLALTARRTLSVQEITPGLILYHKALRPETSSQLRVQVVTM